MAEEKEIGTVIAEMAAAQGGGVAPVEKPSDAAPERGADGKFVSKGDDAKPDAAKEQESNWKALRKEIKSVKDALGQKDAYIQKLQEREDKLLGLLASGKATSPVEAEDPWADLPKDDPDLALLRKKVDPALRKIQKASEARTAKLEAELAALRKEREKESASQSEVQQYRSALSDFTEAKGLDASAAAAITEVIRSGKVGGEDYEDAFENALVYLKGAGKTIGSRKASTKTEEERTSVGGVMPGTTGSAPLSDDYRTLRDQYRKARATGDHSTEDRTFDTMFRKIQEEQAR